MSKKGPGSYDEALDTGVEGGSLHLRYALDTVIYKAQPEEFIVPRKNLTVDGLIDLINSFRGTKPRALVLEGEEEDILWERRWFSNPLYWFSATPEAKRVANALWETSIVKVEFTGTKADKALINHVTKCNAERLEEICQEEEEKAAREAEKVAETQLTREAMERQAQRRAEQYERGLIENPFVIAGSILAECREDFSEKAKDLLANVKKREQTVDDKLHLAKNILQELDTLVRQENADPDQVDDLLATTQKTFTNGFDQLAAKRAQFREELDAARSGSSRKRSLASDMGVDSSNDGNNTLQAETRSNKRRKIAPMSSSSSSSSS